MEAIRDFRLCTNKNIIIRSSCSQFVQIGREDHECWNRGPEPFCQELHPDLIRHRHTQSTIASTMAIDIVSRWPTRDGLATHNQSFLLQGHSLLTGRASRLASICQAAWSAAAYWLFAANLNMCIHMHTHVHMHACTNAYTHVRTHIPKAFRLSATCRRGTL